MNTGLAMVQFAVLAGAVFAVFSAVLCAVAYPLLRRRVLRLHPIQRTRALVAWSLAPLGLSAMLTLLCVLPLDLSSLLGCRGEGQTHFCVAHPHLIVDEHLLWVVYPGLTLLFVSALGSQLYGWWRTRGLLNSVAAVSHYDGPRGIRVLDCAAPLAFTAGLSRPEVYISSSLLASLPSDMIGVVVAHERAHVRRRDGMLQFAAYLFSVLHCPWVRRRLLEDLSLTCEQACDQEAAREAGGPLRVAETLLSVYRLLVPNHSAPAQGMLPFICGGSLIPRIEALLSRSRIEHREPVPRLALILPFSLALSIGIYAAEPIHRSIEALLTYLSQ